MKRDILFFVSGLAFGVAAGYFLFRAVAPGPMGVASHPQTVSSSPIGLDEPAAPRELDEAEVQRLEARIESEPENPEPRAELGRLYMDAGHYEEAIERLEESVELAPDDLDVRNHLALSFLNAGNLEGAVAAYEEALRIDPNDPASLLGMGRIKLYLQRDIQGGLEMWERLVEVAPGSKEAASVREELEALKSAHAGN